MSFKILCPLDVDSDDSLLDEILPPFSEEAVLFVHVFSQALFNTVHLKKYPELMALAFWMRKGRIRQLKRDFEQKVSGRILLGRGRVFHLAPANVDTLFIYSWFLSLLAGNVNIVRVSARTSPQLAILIDLLNGLLARKQFEAIRNRTLLVAYGHDDEVTGYFSKSCDLRVIWGGDQTVQHLRALPLPATASEILFADKFSFSVLNANSFNRSSEQTKIVKSFYNDAYWFGQMACSSPRLVVWVGNRDSIAAAQHNFWSLLEKQVLVKDPEVAAADVMNKLVTSCMLAIEHPQVSLFHDEQGRIHRVQLQKLADVDEQKHCGAGLFFEVGVKDIGMLAPYLTRRNQTVTSFGVERSDWLQLLQSCSVKGIDRIVPFGQALNFSVVWDGIDLLQSFCREITLEI